MAKKTTIKKSVAHRDKMTSIALAQRLGGRHSLPKGIRTAYSRQRMQYWKKKLYQPTTFHPLPHGGPREECFKFSIEEKQRLEHLLLLLAKENPTWKLREYKERLETLDVSVSKEYIRRIFKSWGLSWKKAQYKHPNRYTSRNLQYYKKYLRWTSLLSSWKHVKFLDESHFVNKGNIDIIAHYN